MWGAGVDLDPGITRETTCANRVGSSSELRCLGQKKRQPDMRATKREGLEWHSLLGGSCLVSSVSSNALAIHVQEFERTVGPVADKDLLEPNNGVV
ncbi:hypothetical protein MHYP_G00241960 [Metynnis hypsauchen]